MQSLNGLPLDVLSLSLVFVVDFETLLAAILTFQGWAAAYNAAKKTIIRAVLINFMTPDIAAAALFHIRIGAQMRCDPRPSEAAFIQFVRFGIDETNMLDQYITSAEFWELLECARITVKLEKIWTCRTYENSTAHHTGVMSPSQRNAFRLAVQRIWLLSRFAHHDSLVLGTFADLAVRANLYYDKYGPQDLYNIDTIIKWMHSLVEVGLSRIQTIVGGPAAVLRVYETPGDLSTIVDELVGAVHPGYVGWDHDMWSVFAQRNLVGTGAAGREIPASIVQAVVSPEMPDFQCWRCAARPGARLWNRDNWQDDPLNVQHSSADWLKGALKNNVYERPLFLQSLGLNVPGFDPSIFHLRLRRRRGKKQPVQQYVQASVPDSEMKRILPDLCTLDTRPQNLRESLPFELDAFAGITDDKLLCEACLGQMVTSRLWRWWARKKKDLPEETSKPNCIEGYDCPKQDCNSTHASRYNHACINIKKKKAEEREVEAMLSEYDPPFVVNSNGGS